MKYLVTGGCGFIGSEFVRQILQEESGAQVVNLDLLTYAGNLENLTAVANHPGYTFVCGDIADANLANELLDASFDIVVNFAAESHVDRSIKDASAFLHTNVIGTQTLLDAVRRSSIPRFVQISTDEVYGSLGPEGKFTETTPLAPRSPYSASKAAADHLVLAAHYTHNLDVVITRCSNNYGHFQFPEKLIPLTILHALSGRPIPVYGDGLYVRDWIHVSDHVRGIRSAIKTGKPGNIYNLGGNCEMSNLNVVRQILRYTGQSDGLICHVEDRKGHDRRYAIDHSKATRELVWQPAITFSTGLLDTVEWYRSNIHWGQSKTS